MHGNLLYLHPGVCRICSVFRSGTEVEKTILPHLLSEAKLSSSRNFQDANRAMTEENARNQTANLKGTESQKYFRTPIKQFERI
jgi:hypothetical protein